MADIFVGRERELAKLAALLEQAISGRTQVVFVAGEAGAGKSSLVGELVRRAEEANPEDRGHRRMQRADRRGRPLFAISPGPGGTHRRA